MTIVLERIEKGGMKELEEFSKAFDFKIEEIP